MELIAGIEIDEIEPVHTDERGEVYEFWKGEEGQQVTQFNREAGSLFGGHYHTAIDSAKNPERIVLDEGRAVLRAVNPLDERVGEVVEAKKDITIHPYVWHEFQAVTDVKTLEYRSTVFDGDAGTHDRTEKGYRQYVERNPKIREEFEARQVA